MDWSNALDRQPGAPLQRQPRSPIDELFWTMHIHGLPVIMVLHGKPGYLGCAARMIPTRRRPTTTTPFTESG